MPSLFAFEQRLKSLSSHPKRRRHRLGLSTVPLSAAPHPPEPPPSEPSFKFNQLPVEICAEIFSHCLPEYPRLTEPQTPPLRLALVCRSWYNLVTTSPRLWSCFELMLEETGSSQSEKDEIKRKLRLWLKRSRQHPLSFRIINDHIDTTSDMQSAELLGILASYAPRWQQVHFHGPGGGLALFPNGNSLPALRSLSLQLGRPWNHGFELSRLEIPWLQLSDLNLQFYQDNVHSLDECHRILSAARNLVSCTLNANYTYNPSQATENLALPSLRSLKLLIQGTDEESLAEKNFLDFLEHLSLSNMRGFSVEWLVHRPRSETGLQWHSVNSRFADFLHSSACSLEDLGLAYLPLLDHEIIGYLDGLPSLKILDLKFSLSSHQLDPITDDLLQYMTPRGRWYAEPDVDCLSSLKTLKLQCSGEYLNQHLLLSLIEARVAKNLKTFEVLTVKLLSKDFRERMKAYKDCGLSFSASTLNIR